MEGQRNRILEQEQVLRRVKSVEIDLQSVYRSLVRGEWDQAKERLLGVLTKWPLS
jgi:hypothetical protein